MARRDRGDGSISEDKSRGLWIVRLQVGKTPEGKRKRLVKYAKSKPEAREILNALKDEAKAGVVDNNKLLTAHWLTTWVETIVKPSRRLRTYGRYKQVLDKNIIPCIGGVPFQKLTAVQVEAMLKAEEAKARAAGKSNRKAHMMYAVLRTALKKAVRSRVISRNPLEGVDAPRYRRPKMRVLEVEQADIFRNAAKHEGLWPLFAFLLESGVRHGEALGLQWPDVDFKKSRVFIRHQLLEDKCKIIGLAPPKSKAGERWIAMSPQLTAILRSHREDGMARGLASCPWVFCVRQGESKGGPLMQGNVRRAFRRVLHRAGLPRMRIHDLRHSSITLFIATTGDLGVAQERAGHSQASQTLEYTHGLEKAHKEAAKNVGAVLWGDGK